MHTPETRIYTAVLSGFCVLAIIVFYFLVTIVRYQRNKTARYYKKLHAEISAIEQERLRIARDLHDDLGSTLSGVKFRLNRFRPVREEDILWTEESKNQIGESIVRLRSIVLNLAPEVLQRRGLPEALKVLQQHLFASTGIAVHASYNLIFKSSEKSIHIYRIMQEILSNIVKHAHATAVFINFTMPDACTISVRVQDNGTGFNKKIVGKYNKGQGLRNISSRVDILNAKMYLTSKPGEGTEYLIKIPVNDARTD